jgi:hypothetical protein
MLRINESKISENEFAKKYKFVRPDIYPLSRFDWERIDPKCGMGLGLTDSGTIKTFVVPLGFMPNDGYLYPEGDFEKDLLDMLTSGNAIVS